MLRCLLVSLLFPCCVWAAEIPEFIKGPERSVLQSWLGKDPTLRVATDADCTCDDDLKTVRTGDDGQWKKNPGYQPYFLRGDFNGDRVSDFAVVLIGPGTKRMLAIFNGPYKEGASPAFLSSRVRGALFFGTPRPKPWRLIVGEFFSEGTVLKPQGRTYVPD